MLVYYTDDGSLELGSETFGTCHGYAYIIGNFVINASMSLIIVVLILRFIGKLRFPQSESISTTSECSTKEGWTIKESISSSMI